MWPTTPQWAQAVRTAHDQYASAGHVDPFTATRTVLPIEGGSVTDDATSNIRRQLSLTVPPVQSLYDALAAPGGEVSISKTVRFIDHSTETVPLGVFIVDADQIGYTNDGSISLTCPDRWLRIQRNQFPATGRASVPGNAIWQEIKRLVEGAWATGVFPGWAHLDTSATGKVGSLLWDDGNREAAILNMAKGAGLDVYFNRQGLAVLEPIPQLDTTSTAVFQIDAGSNGIMISADRSRDRSRTRNAVIATTSASDLVITPQEVANTHADDPLSTVGPLGYVPYYFTAETIRTTAQAHAAATAQLARQLGVAQTISMAASPNPALDSGDVVLVILPQIDRTTARDTELHILDTVVTPLMPADEQTLATRSTRPDTDGDA